MPLAETIVASWLLTEAGMAVPDGVITIVPEQGRLKLIGGEGTWRVSGQVDAVPWGDSAGYVLAEVKRELKRYVVLIDTESVSVTPDRNIGREPRCSLRILDATPVAVTQLPGRLVFDAILVAGALTRSVQMAGAVAAVLDLCVQYAGDQVQFGRPLAKFQAIQHQLSILAAEAAAAQIAAQHACRAVDASSSTISAYREICTAKIRTGEAAGKAAAIGHQVHGAIGFTDEHRLHYLTRRLWSWRSEFGAESYWAAHLGAQVMSSGADRLWPDITAQP